MIILTIKTSDPISEVALYSDSVMLDQIKWHAHKKLSVTIHDKIIELLEANSKQWQDIEAVAFFAGPGSFTGLRAGGAVASSLAYGLSVPIVSASGKNWQNETARKLSKGVDEKTASLNYGSGPHITKPRK